MKPIRVAYIDSGDHDTPEGTRLRLELHRKYDGYRWYDATSEQWLDSHDIRTVADAMDSLYAWYDVPDWDLVVGYRDRKQAKVMKKLVVTWASPVGEHINVCRECELRTDPWPRDHQGQEYCQVSMGEHIGTCDIC